MWIGKYRLNETCGGCPEAYDAFIKDEDGNDKYVGYFRLRHGAFTVDTPIGAEPGDEITVYTAYPRGDGIFEHDERDHFLGEGVMALDRHINPPEVEMESPPSYAAGELRKLRQWLYARPDYEAPEGDIGDADEIIAYFEARI